MTNNPSESSKQLNIWEILVFLRGKWLWFVIGSLAGGVIGFAIYYVLPSKYEAMVVISPARVGSVTTGGLIQGVEPEPGVLMLERLKQPGFYTEVMRQRCDFDDVLDYQLQMSKMFNTAILKSPSLVKISWNGPSRAVAKDCLVGLIEAITMAQDKVSAPVIAKIQDQIKITKAQVDEYTAELAVLEGRRSGKGTDGNFNQIVIADKAAQNLRESLVGARRSLTEEEFQLLKPYTQPVTELEPIYISPIPIITHKLASVLGITVGFFLTLFGLFLNLSFRNYRAVTVD
jgi:hypothetical protein